MVKLCGVDGGTHTGVAVYDCSKTLDENMEEGSRASWTSEGRGFRDEFAMANEVFEYIMQHQIGVVVVEDFILRSYVS